MHQKNPIITSFFIIHFPLFLYSEPLWIKSKVRELFREPLTYAGASQWLSGKGSGYNTGDRRDTGSIPGLGRFPGEGNGNWLQYSWLGNTLDRGAWQITVHGVTKSWTWLSTCSPIHHTCLVSVCALSQAFMGFIYSQNFRSVAADPCLWEPFSRLSHQLERSPDIYPMCFFIKFHLKIWNYTLGTPHRCLSFWLFVLLAVIASSILLFHLVFRKAMWFVLIFSIVLHESVPHTKSLNFLHSFSFSPLLFTIFITCFSK